MTYTNRVFGPGWAGRTVRPTNTRPASWPKVRSSAWGSAGLAAAALAAGVAAVVDTRGAAGTAGGHGPPARTIPRSKSPHNTPPRRTGRTVFTARHPLSL